MQTPKNEKVEINFNDTTYLILLESSAKLTINIEEKASISMMYCNSYSKEELSSISTFFNMFIEINDIIPSLLSMINNKQFSIQISNNEMILEILPKIEKVKNIIFNLKPKKMDINELIYKLINIVKTYEKENQEIKKEIKEIKNKLNSIEEKKEKEENKINNVLHYYQMNKKY